MATPLINPSNRQPSSQELKTAPSKASKKKKEYQPFFIKNLTPTERENLDNYDQNFSNLSSQIGKTMACALWLFIPSTLLILCGGMCLTLPGANVIREVVLNAILPGAIGILLSLPLFYKTHGPSNEKRIIRDQWKEELIKILKEKLVKDKKAKIRNADFRNEGVRFIEHNLVPKGNQIYKLDLLTEIKEDKQIKDNPAIADIVKEALSRISRSSKPRTGPKVIVKQQTPV